MPPILVRKEALVDHHPEHNTRSVQLLRQSFGGTSTVCEHAACNARQQLQGSGVRAGGIDSSFLIVTSAAADSKERFSGPLRSSKPN
jgi:hypothetical protein